MSARKGVTAERLALAEKAIRMRCEGATAAQIAERLGVSRSYASSLYNDPDGAKDRARKSGYAGSCEVCDSPTSGSNGRAAAPTVCARCAEQRAHDAAYWTRETVIGAIQEWAAENGRPPSAMDWKRGGVTASGVRTPPFSRVYWTTTNQPPLFGSWADAIEAAGFPRPTTVYERTDETRARLSAALTVWTPEMLLAEVRAWAKSHGRAPAYSEWLARGAQPHADTIARAYGSWADAMRAAGLTPVRLAPGRKPGGVTRVWELAA